MRRAIYNPVQKMTSSSFPITTAQLCGLFTESVVYGIYLVTCGYCAQHLFMIDGRWKRLREYHWAMVIVAALLLTFATLDVTTGFYHNLRAFVFYTGAGGATEAFSDLSFWVSVIKTANVLVTTNIGDGVLIYRCWIVHNKSWLVVAFSIILWFTSVACAIRILYSEITVHASALVLHEKSITPFMKTFWTLTIVINFVTTALLVSKIWRVDRQTRKYLYNSQMTTHTRYSSPLRYAIRVIMESGVLYTTFAFMTYVSYLAGSNWVYPITDMEVPVVGIAFNLIIIRAAARNAEASEPSRPQSWNSIHFRHDAGHTSLSSSRSKRFLDGSQFSNGALPHSPQKPSSALIA
ncbi:hypothetical protein BDQ12DRAFT_657757 [Crucibulum laeve]|uniref:Uncharacterized protein n=1 Tax=Crucibulum laeve TaxID=68775 RepID=A0A5C3LLL6_9AGAR|nr:hypothetical protein BDQ12DRAFT_657757 [Crucibulum laeve]